MNIRASYGTALELGLEEGETDESPTTAYLMIPGERCRGGCSFCPQAKGRSKWLSRVSWPIYDISEVVDGLKDSDLSRICLQSPDVPEYQDKLVSITERLKGIDKPISVSSPPLNDGTLESLEETVDRIGIGIDAATDKLREEMKPSYDPRVFWEYLGKAVDHFGEDKVTAHLIVDLGEDLGELATTIKKALKVGADISLFPYKEKEEKADLTYYRKAQLVTGLIEDGLSIEKTLHLISEDPEAALDRIDEEIIFQTKGCPGCNRPYYTSSPGEEHRNFPREPSQKELKKIKSDLIPEED